MARFAFQLKGLVEKHKQRRLIEEKRKRTALGVGFTGTRDGLTPRQTHVLSQVLPKYLLGGRGDNVFHHGDCVGADAQAHKLAIKTGARIIIHPPLNSQLRAFCEGDITLDPKPYLARNRAIVDACCVLIACPNSRDEAQRSGTWATIRYARSQHKPVYMIFPDSSTRMEPNLPRKSIWELY